MCNRLQGSGLLQWHVWLPVALLSFHGQPESSSPFGGVEECSWGDGHGGKGESTLPDPWLHRWKPGRVDPWSPCKMWSCMSQHHFCAVLHLLSETILGSCVAVGLTASVLWETEQCFSKQWDIGQLNARLFVSCYNWVCVQQTENELCSLPCKDVFMLHMVV